ncbi:MAG: sigma-70 family RNA polymerase sigma factor [Clostridia bacterium]|nr:sigma-70 family RNA polymerase sigma factor [Clostridia bacterium]
MVEGKVSREEFISNNLGLVHSLCKRFIGKGIEYDDLYQAGCIGLVKAYDAFDNERGICFSTYAVPVILGEIRRLFRDGGSVKVSRSIKELSLKINRYRQMFEQKNGYEPSVSQLAEMMEVTAEDITEAICASQPTVSLTYEGEDGITEADLPVDSSEDEISDKLLLDGVLDKLSETERKIIKYRYYDYLTQSKTAQLMNMTQVQVSRSEKKILYKLRQMLM